MADSARSTVAEASETSCYVCGRTTTRIVWREEPYEGRRCECGLTYTHPTPRQGEVDVTVNLHPDEFYDHAAAFKADWVRRHCAGTRLIEVGCDRGFFLEQARRRGFEVEGIEPDPQRARLAEERLSVPIENCTLENRPASAETYDVVYHDDLLAHFSDPVAALRKMSAMLRSDGVLAFEVGILGGVSPVWYRLVGRLSLEHHLYLYSRESLRLLFERAGLEVLAVSTFGLAPAVLMLRTAGALRKLLAALSAPLGQRTEAWHHRLRNIARYRIGAFAPKVGPLTLLIVARPRGEE